MNLLPPSSYSKRFANKFKKFNANSDVISINLDDFNTTLTGIYFANSKKEFKKAQKSDSAFIYYPQKGWLYFNENGGAKKYGDGGLVARFAKKTRLNDKNFDFNGGFNSTPTPDPTKVKAQYSITADKTSVKEGDRVKWTINTQNVPEGTRIFFSDEYENSTNYADYYSKMDGTAINSDGEEKYYFEVNQKGKIEFWDEWLEDDTTDGKESYSYQLFADPDLTDLLATSESIEIIDSSQAPSATPTPAPTPAPSATPTPAPTPAPSATPTPAPTPAPSATPDPSTDPELADDFANNSSTSGLLTIGDTVNGNLESKDDEDWFLVSLTKGKVYRFDLEGIQLTDPEMSLYRSNSEQVTYNDDGGSGYDSRIEFTATSSDRYFISAKGWSGTGTYALKATDVTSASSATLTPAPTPAPSATPDPSLESSPLLDENRIYEGYISGSGETDYFKINANPGDIISLSLTSDSGLYPLLAVVDAAGEVVSDLSNHSGYGSSYYNLRTFNLPSSTDSLYLRVKSQGSSYSGAYAVNFASSPGFESQKTSAPVLSQDGSAPTGDIIYNGSYKAKLDNVTTGEIGIAGEVDYFKLDVEAGNVVALELENDINDWLVFSLVDGNGSAIEINQGAKNSDKDHIGPYDVVTGQTDLYVKISTLNGSATGTYTLSHEIYESQSAVTEKVFELTNNERVKEGLSPLTRDSILDNAAYLHSQDMHDNNYFSHTGRNGSSPTTRASAVGYAYGVGENIASGQISAFDVVEGWMNSPGHRDNILTSTYDEFGTGYYADESDTYWTQKFGNTSISA